MHMTNVRQTCEPTYVILHANAHLNLSKFVTWTFVCKGLTIIIHVCVCISIYVHIYIYGYIHTHTSYCFCFFRQSWLKNKAVAIILVRKTGGWEQDGIGVIVRITWFCIYFTATDVYRVSSLEVIHLKSESNLLRHEDSTWFFFFLKGG